MASLPISLKLLVVSTSVLFLSLLLIMSVPLVHDFSVNQAPLIWSSVLTWLKPPYLYLIINCIIIGIAASSRFQQIQETRDHHQVDKIPVPVDGYRETKSSTTETRSDRFVGVESTEEIEILYDRDSVEEAKEADIYEDKSIVNAVTVVEEEDSKSDEEEDGFLISSSTWVPPIKRSLSSENNLLPLLENLSPSEKPLVSSRFGHRKVVKASPEGGRALRVSKPKRHETLENTWKMITEGRAMPLTRHMRKSETFKDTWENQGMSQLGWSPVEPHAVKKSETFKDRTNYQQPPPISSPSPPASGKLRREPSPSQDELNRRVEAFIKKFNEEMRLQRQESLNQYKEMVSRDEY